MADTAQKQSSDEEILEALLWEKEQLDFVNKKKVYSSTYMDFTDVDQLLKYGENINARIQLCYEAGLL